MQTMDRLESSGRFNRAKAAIITAVAVLVLVPAGFCAKPSRDTERAWSDRKATAQSLKMELERRFPLGASQSDVTDFLRMQPVAVVNEGEITSGFQSVKRPAVGIAVPVMWVSPWNSRQVS